MCLTRLQQCGSTRLRRAQRAPRPSTLGWRVATMAAMLALSASAAGLLVTPQLPPPSRSAPPATGPYNLSNDDRAFGLGCIEAASRCTWFQQPKCASSLVMNGVGSQRMRRDAVELVVAHFTEDITWSDPYDSIRTVYTRTEANQGRHPRASRVVKLHNRSLALYYPCA